MQWLLTHMWMALAATAALGLLFGWSVRGLRLYGKLRRLQGERNIAVGALEQKEGELNALLSSNRSETTVGGLGVNDDGLRQLLEEREGKLQSLTDELARSKAELNELREAGPSGIGGAVSAAAVGAAVAGMASAEGLEVKEDRLDAKIDSDEASLQWRNRYLESRVRSLQARVQEMGAPTGVQSISPEDSQLADRSPDDARIGAANENVTLEKLRWQNDYLRQRLSFFESEGDPAHEQSLSPDDPIEPPETPIDSGIEEAEPASDSDVSLDEELAKLRWRNRYLEGRLAYYEGDKEVEGSDDNGVVELASSAAVVAVGAVGIASSEENDSAVVHAEAETSQDTSENSDLDITAHAPNDIQTIEEYSEVEDARKVLEQGETDHEHLPELPEEQFRGEQPLALDGPIEGEGDDLTAIGGIGPKIQEVLNGLGIYHFDQIAAWTADNVDWIDDHLAFEGRIEREQWVQQAAALSGD